MLARFAEAALELSLDLQRRALATDDNAEAADLADAFHRVGRALRQTLALQARLRRAEIDAAKDARRVALDEASSRRHARRHRVEATVKRLIWTEYEAAEAEDLENHLAERLDDLEAEDGFADQPLEPQVQALCDTLGLQVEVLAVSPASPGPQGWREGDRPP